MLYSIIFHVFFIIALFLVAYYVLKFYYKNKMLRGIIAFLLESKMNDKVSYENKIWFTYKENFESELTQCTNRSCFLKRPKKDFELALRVLLKLIYTGKGEVLFENKVIQLSHFKPSISINKKRYFSLIWHSEGKVWVLC